MSDEPQQPDPVGDETAPLSFDKRPAADQPAGQPGAGSADDPGRYAPGAAGGAAYDPFRKDDQGPQAAPPAAPAPHAPAPHAPAPHAPAPHAPVPYQGAPAPGYSALYPVYAPTETHQRAIVALVLGICSLVMSCGPFTGIPAMMLARQAIRDIDASPQRYNGRGLAVAGFWTGLAGTVILGLVLLFYIAIIVLAITVETTSG